MAGVFLNETITENIKIKFQQINTVSEFANLLNYIENELYIPEVEIFPITFSHLYHLSKTKNNRYNEFYINKKNGSLRQINSPDNQLKRVQKLINVLLQIIFQPYSHYCANGFLLGKDIRRNALPHTDKKYVLNLDIKDFFPSINFRRIKVVLELSPFNLSNNREKIAFLIANISTYNDFLPQGAATSPLLSNVVTQKLDRKISKLCQSLKIKYSRYADDLSFSSNINIFDDKFITSIIKIIEKENFKINNEKTRLKTDRERQEVTGLVVNEKVNIKREYLQKIRAMLNNWEKGGLRFAEERFNYYQPIDKFSYNFKSVLLGHLSFLKLIKGENHQLTKKLRLKYTFLNNLIDYSFIDNKTVNNKLKEDNLLMETTYFEKNETDNKFISFCTAAFHQIENLVNYYYWKKHTSFDDLLNELLEFNPRFKKQFKTLENAKNTFKKISQLNINVLIFLYEKEFFFDKKIYYNKHLTMLREIRNDDLHRCSIIGVDHEELKNEYLIIENERKSQIKRGKNFVLSNYQQKIELNYETLIFLERKNFKEVRKNLKDLSVNIKKQLI